MIRPDTKILKCTLEPAPRFDDGASRSPQATQDQEAIRKWCRDAQAHIKALTEAIRLLS